MGGGWNSPPPSPPPSEILEFSTVCNAYVLSKSCLKFCVPEVGGMLPDAGTHATTINCSTHRKKIPGYSLTFNSLHGVEFQSTVGTSNEWELFSTALWRRKIHVQCCMKKL